MGKPFRTELLALPTTIGWSSAQNIEALKTLSKQFTQERTVNVGAGGSFTAARFAALLQDQSGGCAQAQTPLEFTRSGANLRNTHVIIFTGSGRNRDALSALDCALAREARSTVVVCARSGSPIAERARKYWHTEIIEFDIPTRSDGFLATNSLLATCALLARAANESPPRALDQNELERISDCAAALYNHGRTELIVLASGWASPAGVDFESKCSEAALANVMLADYRHFAHGRHVWLAKRSMNSAVIALATPAEKTIAEKTLKLIPKDIPVISLNAGTSDANATLELLPKVFHFVAGLGYAAGHDPGRPGVPAFGGKLYHLRAQDTFNILKPTHDHVKAMACDRKRDTSPLSVDWERQFIQFVTRLEDAVFTAVVFDFDGTLCSARDRFRGMSDLLVTPLRSMLRAGLTLGIATGRGDSCRDALRQAIPRKYWNRVIIGYYNGAEISSLDDDETPSSNQVAIPALQAVLDIFKRMGLEAVCMIKPHQKQITIKPLDSTGTLKLTAMIEEAVQRTDPSLRLVHSSHSLDILAPNVTKSDVARRCASTGGDVLCIGDRGQWPGNDCDLLAHSFSLSVDTVSSSQDTCWNIAPAGIRCEQATHFYLHGFTAVSGKLKFSLSRSLSNFGSEKDE